MEDKFSLTCKIKRVIYKKLNSINIFLYFIQKNDVEKYILLL